MKNVMSNNKKNEDINRKGDDFGGNQNQHRPFQTGQANYDTLDKKHTDAMHKEGESQKHQAEEIDKHRPHTGPSNVHASNVSQRQGSGLETDGDTQKGAIKGMSSGSGENAE
jgi:hypothetical protein